MGSIQASSPPRKTERGYKTVNSGAGADWGFGRFRGFILFFRGLLENFSGSKRLFLYPVMIFQSIKGCLAHSRFFPANKWFKCLPERSAARIRPVAASASAWCDGGREERRGDVFDASHKGFQLSRAQHLLLFTGFHVFFTQKPRVATAEGRLLSQRRACRIKMGG